MLPSSAIHENDRGQSQPNPLLTITFQSVFAHYAVQFTLSPVQYRQMYMYRPNMPYSRRCERRFRGPRISTPDYVPSTTATLPAVWTANGTYPVYEAAPGIFAPIPEIYVVPRSRYFPQTAHTEVTQATHAEPAPAPATEDQVTSRNQQAATDTPADALVNTPVNDLATPSVSPQPNQVAPRQVRRGIPAGAEESDDEADEWERALDMLSPEDRIDAEYSAKLTALEWRRPWATRVLFADVELAIARAEGAPDIKAVVKVALIDESGDLALSELFKPPQGKWFMPHRHFQYKTDISLIDAEAAHATFEERATEIRGMARAATVIGLADDTLRTTFDSAWEDGPAELLPVSALSPEFSKKGVRELYQFVSGIPTSFFAMPWHRSDPLLFAKAIRAIYVALRDGKRTFL